MSLQTNNPIMIYNLFPRVFKNIDSWTAQLDHIASLGFNAVYVNPFNETGGSKSLYAIKDYYKINSEFTKRGSDGIDDLKKFVKTAHDKNLAVYMDLVINHTANECALVKKNPQWYKKDSSGNIVHPFAIDPANPCDITTWGDLSEINYENNPDFKNLQAYWDKVISYYQDIGFEGFRCDAAYKVPCEMWGPLIEGSKKRIKGTLFLAETLGCTLDQMRALSNCGFDYFFNSSKWWNFDASWCLEQHASFKSIAPSISFPESHDTTRVAGEPPATLEWQKNRYTIATIFSKGLLMPVGYEFGATEKLDVVNSKPTDFSKGKWNLTSWIGKVNRFKLDSKDLTQEGNWEAVWGYDDHVFYMIRTSDDQTRSMGVLINKDWYSGTTISKENLPWQFGKFKKTIRIFDENLPRKNIEDNLTLAQSEILLFIE